MAALQQAAVKADGADTEAAARGQKIVSLIRPVQLSRRAFLCQKTAGSDAME